MNDKNSLVKNILSLGVVQIANYVLPLISIPIIVRIIGPGNYGIINYYNSFVAYFILLINYGFDYSGTRYIAIEKDNIFKRNQHFTKVLFAKSLLFLVSVVIFSISILFISKSANETKVAVYTFLIAISWVLTPNWFYQGMQQLTKVALFNFLSKIIFTVLILAVIREKSGFIWQPLILSLTQIAVSAISLVYAVRKFNISLAKVNLKLVLDLLWEDRLIFFSMLATNLYTDTNIVVLGIFESKVNVGYFTAAWKLIFVFLVIISFPISQAMFPYIADTFSKNLEKGIEQIKRILPMIIYLAVSFSIALFLFAGILIRGFYGPDFSSTIIVFRILTIVPVLSFINTVLGLQTMVNLKMDRPYFIIIFSGGIFSVIFNIIIIHFYGYLGCAWSWIIAEIIIALILHLYLRSKGYHLFVFKNFTPKSVFAEFKTLVSNLKNRAAIKAPVNNRQV
jgi:PST family polysaccharide transporter